MPYHGYYYGIDMYYIVLVLPCVLFAFWAQSKVNSTFNRYSRVQNLRGLTGAQAAEAVLRYNGVSGVRIEYVSGKLTDHFDPRSNVIRLSSAVYSSTSVASIGVAAHEAGHAVQYAIGYAPIKLRAAIIPLTQFGSMAAMPLPVELDASRRALQTIQQNGLLTADEYPMAKKTLTAAALTYVAALATSLAQLLRLVLIFGGRDRNDR